MSRSPRLVLAALLLLAPPACRRGSRAGPPSLEQETAVIVRVKPQPAVRAEPGTRSVLLLRLEIEGVAPLTEIHSLELAIDYAAGSPPPLTRPRLFQDRDSDGIFDPAADRLIADMALASRGRSARAGLSRTIAKGNREDWLVLAGLSPVAMGMELRLALGKLSVDPGVAERSGSALGPPASVGDGFFAPRTFLTGGGARAALKVLPAGVLEGTTEVARVLIAGNPVTDLRREAHGLYSFLLPPVPAGRIKIQALGPGGGLLLEESVAANSGTGPASFLDGTLSRLPRDHAFSQDAEVADMNGDGAPDLLIPSYARQKDRLYLNDGFGSFADVSATHVPAVSADTVHLEPVDVDGDGDVDVAVAVEGGQNRIWLNDGTGALEDVTKQLRRMPVDEDYSEDIQAADIDRDGDFDLVVANLVDPKDQRKGGQIKIYVNDGSGHFSDGTAGRIPIEPTRAYDVELGDLDGDGDLDLFAAAYGEQNRLYRNDGAGVFADVSPALPLDKGFHTSAALGDVDGDGDLDILAGTFIGQSLLLLNRGAMQFGDGTSGLPQQAMSTYDVCLADLNGDGNLDILYANTANPSVLALGDGRGGFSEAKEGAFFTPDDNAYDVQVLDADGDGALDVLISAWGDRQDTLYLSRAVLPPPGQPRITRVEPNYGPPAGGNWVTLRGHGFEEGVSVSVGGLPATELQVIDERTIQARWPAGQPGPASVVLHTQGGGSAEYPGAYAYEPLPEGAFEDVTQELLGSEPEPSAAVAAGDLNRDGLPDLVFADQKLGARVRLGTGGGKLKRSGFVTISASANDVLLVDLNADGKLDLVLVDAAAPPWLFPGNGDGGFQAARRLAGPAGAEEVAAGDLDGDGDPDLVFAVPGPEQVYRNDGKWSFTRLAEAGMASDPSRGLALGDADGDGDLDLFVANFMQRSRLYLNDGKGRFIESKGALPAFDGDQSYSIALADVDGDGDLDPAIANGGAQVNRLLLGDGRGRFEEAPAGVFRAALGGGAHVTFADVDLDGDPDLFSSHFWGNNHLYFNEGGRFAERAGMLPNSPGGFAGAAFTDIDGDRDPDLVLAAFWGGSRILRNPRLR